MADVRPNDLRTGDVLLYHGTAWLSRMIRLFDGGEYNHASIWTGTDVMEALGDGITFNTLQATFGTSNKYIDVYRFRDPQGQQLGDGLPVEPVTARINHYRENKQRYAYEALLLLAMIASTRRGSGVLPGFLARMLRNLVDSAADVLQDMVNRGKEPVICSELVYRCYVEGGAEYFIPIRGADIAAIAAAEETAAGMTGATAETVTATAEFNDDAQAFLERFTASRAALPAASAGTTAIPGSVEPTTRTQSSTAKSKSKSKPKAAVVSTSILVAPDPGITPAVGGAAVVAAVPDYVTPKDLSRTPYLYRVGTLRI